MRDDLKRLHSEQHMKQKHASGYNDFTVSPDPTFPTMQFASHTHTRTHHQVIRVIFSVLSGATELYSLTNSDTVEMKLACSVVASSLQELCCTASP